jgi:hypothetical protein
VGIKGLNVVTFEVNPVTYLSAKELDNRRKFFASVPAKPNCGFACELSDPICLQDQDRRL